MCLYLGLWKHEGGESHDVPETRSGSRFPVSGECPAGLSRNLRATNSLDGLEATQSRGKFNSLRSGQSKRPHRRGAVSAIAEKKR